VGSDGRDGILDAMKGHACHAKGKFVSALEFSVGMRPMGSVVPLSVVASVPSEALPLELSIQRETEIGSVFTNWELIHNGTVAYSQPCEANSCTFAGTVPRAPTEGYYYVRVRNDADDKNLAVSAPVWLVRDNPVDEMVFAEPPSRQVVETCTARTLRVVDEAGQPLKRNEQGYPAFLETTGPFTVYADAACTEPAHFVDISAAHGEAHFFVHADEAGEGEVVATAQHGVGGLLQAAQDLFAYVEDDDAHRRSPGDGNLF